MNENHRRSLLSSFVYIDELLREVERAASSSQSPFSDLISDLQPTQRQVVVDYVQKVREQMMDGLQVFGIQPRAPQVTGSWSIQTSLTFAEISIEDASPSRLRGYGVLSPEDQVLIERVEGDLERTIRRLQVYLVAGRGKDLGDRLARLEGAAVNLELAKTLERVIREQGLVEFRGALEAIVERIEAKTFEVAVFGRVSSGKSSLLNAVLEMDILPVGVTPVTAVPTRIAWGDTPKAEIRFAEAPTLEVSLEHLVEFVSEQANPGNAKRVVSAVARTPSLKLRGNLVFVDTPGVGSLAASGARESYSYLPRCDLGVLLVDAASAPGREDLEILRLLYESGIPAQVVISKVDLLSETDRSRARKYLQEKIASHLGLAVEVHFVSAIGPEAALAGAWFDTIIAPLRQRTASLSELSAKRKLAALSESVVAALKVSLNASTRAAGRNAGKQRAKVEELALGAEQTLRDTARKCERIVEELRSQTMSVMETAAREISHTIVASSEAKPAAAVSHALANVADKARSQIRDALVSARDLLRKALGEIAMEVPGLPVQSEEIELELVTQPSLTMPAELTSLELEWPRLFRRMPKLFERRLLAQLRASAEEPVTRTLYALESELRKWSARSITRLADHFAVQSEPLRAHARQALAGVRSGDEMAVRRALQDLSGASVKSSVAPQGNSL